ncbi:SDR family oxidoreductase [candidate division KSB1 bacterium]
MKKVLVAGATGYLGNFVVREFKERGYQVRALARNAAGLDNIREYIDKEHIGEATNPNSLLGICKNIDIVFSSIGITKQNDGLTYMDVDYQANKNLLEEALKAGVSKFIYVSVFNAEKMKNLKAIQAKLKFEDELKNSGLNYTIIYPNGFFSDMLEYLKMAEKGKGYVFGSGDHKINPIHGKDLAEVCVNAASGNDKEVKVGGPDIFTHNEILAIAFDIVDKPVKISKMPIWMRNFILSAVKTFTSVKTYGPMEFFMTVLAMDMATPAYGKYHLRNFFLEQEKRSSNECQN